jgi:hypothetical protein
LLADREAGRAGRREAMDVVRNVVPGRAFQMQIEELELDDDINRALSRLENVGELMIRMLADEENLERMLKQGGAGDDAMEAIRYALDDLVVLRDAMAQSKAEPELEPEPEPEPLAAEPVAAPRSEPLGLLTPVDAEVEPVAEMAQVAVEPTDEEAALLPAFGDVDDAEEVKPAAAPKEERRKPARFEPEDVEESEVDDDLQGGKRGKKGKRKQRELVFDEERGEVVARRRRKGSRRREEWDEYLD